MQNKKNKKQKTGIDILLERKSKLEKQISSVEKLILKKQELLESLKDEVKNFDVKIKQAENLANKFIEISSEVDFENSEVRERILSEYEEIIAKIIQEKNSDAPLISETAEEFLNGKATKLETEGEENDEKIYAELSASEKSENNVFSSERTETSQTSQ